MSRGQWGLCRKDGRWVPKCHPRQASTANHRNRKGRWTSPSAILRYVICIRGLERQPQGKRRPNPGFAVDGDRASMLIDDDIVRNREPLTRSLSHRFGRKELIEYPGGYV